MFRPDFPVRVLEKYGWAHSLHFNTDEEVVRAYRSTPKDWPWFIHLAEGTDEVAAGEYRRLKALGCVGKNTVIVHGVGVPYEDIMTIDKSADRVHGTIWCPTTSEYLLGKSPQWHEGGRWKNADVITVLGSDSRLTSEGDLLHELRAAVKNNHLDGSDHHWQYIDDVTFLAARVIMKQDTGYLKQNFFSDFFVYNWLSLFDHLLQTSNLNKIEKEDLEYSHHPVAAVLCYSSRSDLALIVRGGIPQIGDPEMMAKFPHIQTVEATLDGVPKAINIHLARQIARCSLKEPGLELGVIPKRRFFVL
ncbi:MAG: hypothetical protein H7Y09_15025 [Chitinophagaceae bacterium]|nr:hypothetical protein [Anaerolineae bacterium]